MNAQTNVGYRRIILPLDGLGSAQEIDTILKDLGHHIGFGKVGLELMMAMGAPQAIACVHSYGLPIMADGKIHDIEKTMGAAVRRLVQHPGVAMFTIHASAPKKGLAAAVKHRGEALVIGVTILTDFDEPECTSVFGDTPGAKVTQFALRLLEAGAQAIVCSPLEVIHLSRDRRFDALKKITPGVRPLWAAAAGQTRFTTPSQAILAGADLLVIGDPLLNPKHGLGRQRAAELVAKEIEEAWRIQQNPRSLRRLEEDELRAILAAHDGLVVESHIVYTSSKHGRAYVNWRPLLTNESSAPSVICEEVAARMTEWAPEVIVGPETGGATIARWAAAHLSRHLDQFIVPVAADKDGLDEQGRQKFRLSDQSREALRGRRVAFVEDVLTTGGSLRSAVDLVRTVDGTIPVGAVVLTNRGNITADTLSVPQLESLLHVPLEAWAESDCPECRQGTPINQKVGHGRQYLEQKAKIVA